MSAALPEAVRAANTPVEVWHADEARVGQQGSLTYAWAEKGSRPAAPRDPGTEWAYLSGAVCAGRGVGTALVRPDVNIHAMNLHLAEISRSVASGAHGLVVLDGAGWHQTGKRLRIPHTISLLHLPPRSPELNPVEDVWHTRDTTSPPAACSTATTPSWTPAAPPGMRSWPCQTASAPSQPEPGPKQSSHRAVGIA